jgi:hypothetical protein
MTTVVASFIAIVLFGMIMIGTISYGDSLGMMSAPDSVAIAQRMQSAAELVSHIQSSTGSRPTSADDLVEAGMPPSVTGNAGDLAIRCTDDSCSPMDLCLSMPSTAENVVAVRAAAGRIKGVVSGACGDAASGIGSDVVVTMRL